MNEVSLTKPPYGVLYVLDLRTMEFVTDEDDDILEFEDIAEVIEFIGKDTLYFQLIRIQPFSRQMHL